MNSDKPKSLKDYNVNKIYNGMKSLLAIASVATVISQKPANAIGGGNLEEVNVKLADYGLPPMLFVPPGFAPVVSEFGRGNAKDVIPKNPIVVQFSAPKLWVVEKTTVNNNGESGKIAANDYIKGDSAYLFIVPLSEAGGAKLSIDSKQLYQKILLKATNQKGDVTEAFKINQIKPGVVGVDGQNYFIVDFEYKINTEAGFLISRKGVASLTSVGSDIQALISVTTDKRYKTLEENIRDIAASFRVYKLNSGIFAS